MNKINKLFSYFIVVLLVESFILGFMFGELLPALIIGIPATIIPIYFYQTASESLISKHVTAIAFMVFAGLHIHQAHGLIEVHFEIFILMALLIGYQEWRVFVTAIAVVAVHHFGFFFLQTSGSSVYIFDQDRLMFSNLFIHAVYAITEAAIAGYMASLMAYETGKGKALSQISYDITEDPNAIDLSLRTTPGKSKTLLAYNEFLQLLSDVIMSVKSQVKELNVNSNNLISTKEDLMDSALHSQNETNLIATSVEEMTVTVASIAQDVNQLNEQMTEATSLTQSASQDIVDINQQNEELTAALETTNVQVNELANATNDISTVLSEISGIAEQTNLLALNAAIEAARAGEQGRGFAVVADEVRALANRSKESTDKIGDILGTLQGYSKSTTDAMENSLAVVKDVLASASKAEEGILQASNLINESNSFTSNVVSAVDEQTTATHSIAESAEKLRLTVHDDMQKAEILAAAAEAVNHSASEMESSIVRFK